ncbi:hypothetical protein SEPCBS119000_003572 [Sporothrix epigloea]|uniref:Moz protein represents a chromatin-associated acetyltransferase n=1 Tax=Sporothrix epigloea TaxID=1892477 RepID=A0ABP0DRL7_9PEZI
MPSVRHLALPPAPGQHMQLLRSAGSGNTGSPTWGMASSRHNDDATEGNVHARAHARPPSFPTTRSASSPQPDRYRNTPKAVAFLDARPIATSRVATRYLAPCCLRILRRQWPLPASARPFNSVTMAKQVAFPRHGKAVAPRLPEDAKNSNSEESAVQVPRDTVEESPAAPPRGKQPATKNDKQAKAQSAPEPEDDIAVAAASKTPKEVNQASPPLVTSTKTDASTPDEISSMQAPTVKLNVMEAFGSSNETANLDTTDPFSIAADAAAASVAAAETAGVAADIVNGVDAVIELGPPPEIMAAAISAPDKESLVQQQRLPQTEDQASGSPPPTRQQLLAHNKLPPPHLAPPPYVHHFDSYSLVKQLEEGGYQKEQAVTAMKAVRSLLAQHLDMAQSSLVSKSDVENEAYLFKAACAELSIEVRNNRRRADELVRQQRTLLQHEVDIAAQSVNQELLTLADVVKELFDDRKMAVREEQKTRESAIQQLSYKITIMLNSEMRSEIEGLRWVLIRRSVLGIIFMAILTLGTLRYASYISHEKQRNAERALWEAREAEAQRFADTKIDTSAPYDAAETLAAN